MAKPRTTLSISIRTSGLREAIRALNRLPGEAEKDIKAASLSIAGALAADMRQEARKDPQSALLARTVRAISGTVPEIRTGGVRRVGRNRVPAYKVLFGSEFGSHALKQYRTFTSDGYWFFRTAKRRESYIVGEWFKAVDEVVRKWGD